MDELEIPEEDRKTSRDSIEKTAKRMTSIGYGYLPAKKGQAIWRVEKREDEGEGSNNIGRHSFRPPTVGGLKEMNDVEDF